MKLSIIYSLSGIVSCFAVSITNDTAAEANVCSIAGQGLKRDPY